MNDAFTVRLERVFHGPLDLLLHLVREQEVEIHEVELARVLEGYLDYLKALRELDIEVAGEFLVMAATLMAIKSRSLLPGEEVDLEGDLDPRDELIARLIEYRRFKEAADRLGEGWERRAASHARGAAFEPPETEPVIDLGEISRWDLLAAFSRLMRETLANRPHRVVAEARALRWYVSSLAERIRAARSVPLSMLIASLGEPSRETVVGSFCALLELVKLGLVGVAQAERGGEISIELRPEHADDIESVVRSSVFDDETQAAELGVGEGAQAVGAEAPEPARRGDPP